ncbi:DNA polymerase III subunit gamma/tau [Aciduricibacillus chroicocephali]|uniref:DNA-directed DNA polymerase n=1 Tax=Aciduricibacillus chroicocephali TaxID=3054939 RepID=A0ABY9KVB2_9BACI|nr:DNA polymerase III subunit gamma/tau [Bacillaceae bacterium 44XB]
MSYQALYRTWRPRTFRDVVGQEHITRTLQNAIVQQKFTHAYLFSGPRGTGKTSAAKIFAKAVNCERGPAMEPCNECAACRGIQDGSISDVFEIDAASNTSVDDIREIRDKVKYAPSVVPYKVYIIDEVHMISVNAFNALLKTLEEPPGHVIFILATTEPHKIPLTIISRCQRFDFKPISNHAIVGRMQEITDSEQVAVTEEALETVALAAEGGMRDALSILDQAISYSENEVGLDDVLAVTGSVAQSMLEQITASLYGGESQEALSRLDDMLQEGKDPGRFVFDMIYFLRDLLLYQSAPELADLLERARVNETFKKLAGEVTSEWLESAILEFNRCQQEMKWTNSPRVFIEIALLQIAGSGRKTLGAAGSIAELDLPQVQQLMDKVSQLEKQLQSLKANPTQHEQNGGAAREQRRPQARASKNSFKIPYEKIRTVLDQASKPNLKEIAAQWGGFLTQLKTASPPAHATILDSKPAAASDRALVVAFKYEIHCSLFMDNRELVENVLYQQLGKQLEIIPIPQEAWQELREQYLASHDKAQEHDGDASEGTEGAVQAEIADPLIEEARKLVGDDLLEIHED